MLLLEFVNRALTWAVVEDGAIPVNAVEKSSIAQSHVHPEEPSEGGGSVPVSAPV